MNITQSKNKLATFRICPPTSKSQEVKSSLLNSQQQMPLPSTQDQITFKWFRSIHEVPDIWSTLAIDDYFLQKEYLSCIEAYPPEGMRFVYFVFYKNEIPAGFALGQIQYFNTSRSLNSLKRPDLKETFNLKAKRFIANRINFHTLMIGNLLITGEHGFYFSPNVATLYNIGELLHDAASTIIKLIPEEKISVTIVKEFYKDNLAPLDTLYSKGYNQMAALPNMIFNVRPEWKTFDDYLKAMSSKYRTRAKRAFKKGKEIEKRELSLEEIEHYNDQLFALYQQIAAKADFNALFLHQNYFKGLKIHLKDRFQLFGYFLEGELIGFYTIIYNGTTMDAHFLGINSQLNHKHQIYLNMLYDLVRAAISNRSIKISMARTALEIKSSVGAVAYDMFAYVKFRNPLMNATVRRLSSVFFQQPEWTPRKPFKE